MRLRHIEVFEAIMRSGSVTGAADLIHISQPAVTRTLQHAESQLGFRLFHRIKGRLYPTPEATALYREVESVSQALAAVRTLAQNLKAADKGHLRISATPVLAQELLPTAIERFRSKYPGITCTLETHHWQEVFSALLTSKVDIAFADAPLDHPAIHRRSLHNGRMIAAFPREKKPKKRSLGVRELSRYPFISLMENVNPLSAALRKRCEQARVALNPAISVMTCHLALWFVTHGAGIAVIDEFTASKADINAVSLRPLLPSIEFDVSALYAKHRPPSVYTERFTDYVASACVALRSRYETLLTSSA
ncbi:MAG: LysR family transcriptional regulator [Burkholderiales bacterium]